MSQAQTDTPNTTPTTTPLGVQAAAAATNGAAANPPTDDAGTEAKKAGNKLFIVVGQIHEFETFAQAEKFLNADNAPAQYHVLRGRQMKSKHKITLR